MPLIMMCGFPSSGKTRAAEQLANHLSQNCDVSRLFIFVISFNNIFTIKTCLSLLGTMEGLLDPFPFGFLSQVL